MSVTIRLIQPQDAVEAAQLCHQLGYERSADEIRLWIFDLPTRRESQAVYVASLEGRVVGWIDVSIVYHLQSPANGLINGLVVEEGLRGQNIGRLLCQKAEAWTWGRGLASIRVTSRSTREGAHRFYLRDGYAKVKTSEVFEKTRPAGS